MSKENATFEEFKSAVEKSYLERCSDQWDRNSVMEYFNSDEAQTIIKKEYEESKGTAHLMYGDVAKIGNLLSLMYE